MKKVLRSRSTFQTEDKRSVYTLERKEFYSVLSNEPKVHFVFYKELLNFIVFSRILKKNFDCCTFVQRRSFFSKNSLIYLGLFQFADFVCKPKGASITKHLSSLCLFLFLYVYFFFFFLRAKYLRYFAVFRFTRITEIIATTASTDATIIITVRSSELEFSAASAASSAKAVNANEKESTSDKAADR